MLGPAPAVGTGASGASLAPPAAPPAAAAPGGAVAWMPPPKGPPIRGRPLHPAAASASSALRPASADGRNSWRGSRSPAPGAGAPAGLDLPSEPALLQEIVHLLTEQKVREQLKVRREEDAYSDPEQVLKKLPPSLRKVCHKWYKDLKSMLALQMKHTEIMDVQAKHHEEQSLQRDFQQDLKRVLQWPALYLANAQPSEHAYDQQLVADHAAAVQAATAGGLQPPPALVYKVDEAWQKMRLRHAREAQEFRYHHSLQCLEMVKNRNSPVVLRQLLLDQMDIWRRNPANVVSDSQCGSYQRLLENATGWCSRPSSRSLRRRCRTAGTWRTRGWPSKS